MPQRTAYAGRRVARRTPPRRPSRPASPQPRPAAAKTRPKAPPAASPQSKRRLWQLMVSAALLLAVIAVKFLSPATLDRYRAALLDLLGADTDFVEVFSAAGHAFSGDGALSDALNDAYTAVFGPSRVQSMPTAAVSRTDALPADVDMLQQVLGFDYAPPVTGTITSLFGCRSDPLESDGRFHYGLDIAGEEGTVISAFAAGTVTAVADSSDLGRYVTVAHPNGYETLYAHCSKITASSGQKVALGDPIAEMGSTGRVTGTHLHFELHRDTVFLNPIYYVAA